MESDKEVFEQLRFQRKLRAEKRRNMHKRAQFVKMSRLDRQEEVSKDDKYANTGLDFKDDFFYEKSVGSGYEVKADSCSATYVSGLTLESSVSDLSKKLSLKPRSAGRDQMYREASLRNGNGGLSGSDPSLRRLEPIESEDKIEDFIGVKENSTKFFPRNSLQSSISYPSTGDGTTNEHEADNFIDSHSTFTKSDLKSQEKQESYTATATDDLKFINTNTSDMTFGRRIALYLMDKATWYNPRRRNFIDISDSFWTSSVNIDNNIVNSDIFKSGFSSSKDSKSSSRMVIPEEQIPAVKVVGDDNNEVNSDIFNSGLSSKDLDDRSSNKDSKSSRMVIPEEKIPSAKVMGDDNNEVNSDIFNSGYLGFSSKDLDDRSSNQDSKSGRMVPATEVVGDDKPQQHLKQDEIITPFSTKRKKQPSLRMAWAYFEHSLPRYILDGNKARKRRRFYDRNSQGEGHRKTKLYSPIFTPIREMEDFGVGIGTYFYTLRAVIIMTLIAGFINIPSLLYFYSSEYSDNEQEGLKWYLKGSAGCTWSEYVPCPSCSSEYFDDNRNYITTSKGGEDLLFVRKHNCGEYDDDSHVRPRESLLSITTTIFIIVSLFIISIYQNMKEVSYHEDKPTIQDYSIVIRNPPENATDPEEWKSFFEENFKDKIHVTCCTVVVDNDKLVNALVKRRETLQRIERILPDHKSHLRRIDYILEMAGLIQEQRNIVSRLCVACGFHKGVPEYCKLLVRLNNEINDLASKVYAATNVYITFETAEAQKKVLSALTVAPISSRRNRKEDVTNVRHLFRKELVLRVEEAEEPTSLRWKDFNTTILYQLTSVVAMMIVAGLITALASLAVKLCFERGAITGGVVVSFFNLVFPVVANALTNYERHKSEGSKQISFYAKLLIFSWVNTVVVITIITPFEAMNVLLDRVFAVFVAELITFNIFQLTDIYGNFKRHVVAPRMKTQEAMNTAMEGFRFDLATRYTNMMKILFLTLWYCSIFPSVFFICSLGLGLNFFIDRFSLMRSWIIKQKFRSAIPRINQLIFFPAAVCIMSLITAYFWAGMPFDNVCHDDSIVDSKFTTGWPAPGTEDMFSTTFTHFYKYCKRNMFERIVSFDTFSFLVGSNNEAEQEGLITMVKGVQAGLTRIYLWISLVIFCITLIFYTFSVGYAAVSYFHASCKKQKPIRSDAKIPFSTVSLMIPYMPKIKSRLIPYPLTPYPVKAMDASSVELNEKNDLTVDVVELLQDNTTGTVPISAFGRAVYWTPSLEEI